MNKTPSPYSTALRIWYIGWKHKNMRTSLSSPTNDCQLLTRIPKKQAGNGTPERVALKWAQNKMPWFPWAEQRQPLMHSASAVVRKFSQGEFLTSWAHRIRLQFQGPSLCLFVSLPCSPSPLTLFCCAFLLFLFLSFSSLFYLLVPLPTNFSLSWRTYYCGMSSSFITKAQPPQWQQHQAQCI